MSSAKITLIGFHNYMLSYNDNLFSKLVLPASIDKDTLVNNILLRGGEFETLHNNPYFIQDAIGVWSKKWERTFTKWVDALSIDYDPLNNYDRTEEYIDIIDGTVKNTGTVDSVSNDTSKIESDNIGKKSAYDSNDFSNDTKNENTTESSADSSNTRTDNLTQTDKRTLKHSARMYGNIGVTTSQQMLESELSIAEWNIYEHITDIFLREFVLPVY